VTSAVRFTIVNIGTLSMNKFWDETERKRSPSATCTLLDIDGLHLLVDPSPYPEQLEQRLFATTGMRLVNIDMVFVTHYHADHRFGLELFAGKPWFMAFNALVEWRQTSPQDASLISQFAPIEGHLPPGVSLLPTPGHTIAHHSLVVDTANERLVVAGDAVMTSDYFDVGEGFHNSVDFQQAHATIMHIRQIADIVIPGHGNYFLVHRKPMNTS
jgi:glyoxylase-like metal-dependent hydrolase (beta-lactamase superfamily II)